MPSHDEQCPAIVDIEPAYIIDNMQKAMRVPFWCKEMGPTSDGTWTEYYVRVKTAGAYAGLFPTIKECKLKLRLAVSWIGETGLEPELWMVKMPNWGEPMPRVPEKSGSYPLSDDWIVNDDTAL